MLTNSDLINRAPDESDDDIFVVTEPPNPYRSTVTVRINFDAPAAALDSRRKRYPDNPTVSEIAGGSGDCWLLSGGALITDHHERIAIGLRDGNARDQFLLTNIGAGRCDRKLDEHCWEEVASEFLLCVKDNRGIWRQAEFKHPQAIPGDSQQLLLCNLNKPAVEKRVSEILSWIYTSGGMLESIHKENVGPNANLPNEILVEWYDPNTEQTIDERLRGYVLVDEANHTTEFRYALRLELSSFQEIEIFFGEGTGYAEWLSLAEIRNLVSASEVARRDFVTPFMRAL